MKTSKPFSTVSYNTDDFLKSKLNELLNNRKIEYWCYVCHAGELDDNGEREKEHKHVLIIPNGRIDTMELSQTMLELDPTNIKKPLKCMDFRSSKEDEWFLYASHDPDYLRSKMLVREYVYDRQDFISSDDDETDIKWRRAFHESDYMKNSRLLKLLTDKSASQLVANGFIQPQQAFQMQCYYRMLKQGKIENYEEKTGAYYSPEETPFGKAIGKIYE